MKIGVGLAAATATAGILFLAAGAASCGGTNEGVSSEINVPPASSAADNTLVIPPLPPDAGRAAVVTEPVEAVHPATTLAVPARDPRMAARRPRSRALVLTEAQGLDRLLDSTAKNAPDRPQLQRRLAETYSELSFTASGADAVKAREEAIKYYTALNNDYPNYAQRDEVLYFLALAHELNGTLHRARSTYYDLIKTSPQSSYIPHAYFAFGELFFTEAKSDPSKWDLAAQAFMECMKYPAPKNPLMADTLLRMGEVYMNKGEKMKAQTMFAKLRNEFPQSGAAQQIPQGQ
jgi:TolA-binding protein